MEDGVQNLLLPWKKESPDIWLAAQFKGFVASGETASPMDTVDIQIKNEVVMINSVDRHIPDNDYEEEEEEEEEYDEEEEEEEDYIFNEVILLSETDEDEEEYDEEYLDYYQEQSFPLCVNTTIVPLPDPPPFVEYCNRHSTLPAPRETVASVLQKSVSPPRASGPTYVIPGSQTAPGIKPNDGSEPNQSQSQDDSLTSKAHGEARIKQLENAPNELLGTADWGGKVLVPVDDVSALEESKSSEEASQGDDVVVLLDNSGEEDEEEDEKEDEEEDEGNEGNEESGMGMGETEEEEGWIVGMSHVESFDEKDSDMNHAESEHDVDQEVDRVRDGSSEGSIEFDSRQATKEKMRREMKHERDKEKGRKGQREKDKAKGGGRQREKDKEKEGKHREKQGKKEKMKHKEKQTSTSLHHGAARCEPKRRSHGWSHVKEELVLYGHWEACTLLDPHPGRRHVEFIGNSLELDKSGHFSVRKAKEFLCEILELDPSDIPDSHPEVLEFTKLGREDLVDKIATACSGAQVQQKLII